MIAVKDLEKKYSGFQLNIQELELPDSGIVVLFGNNGAGKTTLIRCLLDLIGSTGTIKFDEHKAGDAAVKEKTAAYLSEENLIDFFTCTEYFNFIKSAWSIPDGVAHERFEIAKPLMSEFSKYNSLIKDLSSGNRRKVGLVGQLLVPSKYLFLDEPFNDLDPSSQAQLKKVLVNYLECFNPLMLLSSNAVDSSLDIASRAILIEDGKIIKDNSINSGKIELIRESIHHYFEEKVSDEKELKLS